MSISWNNLRRCKLKQTRKPHLSKAILNEFTGNAKAGNWCVTSLTQERWQVDSRCTILWIGDITSQASYRRYMPRKFRVLKCDVNFKKGDEKGGLRFVAGIDTITVKPVIYSVIYSQCSLTYYSVSTVWQIREFLNLLLANSWQKTTLWLLVQQFTAQQEVNSFAHNALFCIGSLQIVNDSKLTATNFKKSILYLFKNEN